MAVGTVVPQLVSRVFHSHGTLVTPAMVHSCYKLSFSPYVVLLTSLATKGSDNFFLTPFNFYAIMVRNMLKKHRFRTTIAYF